MVRLAGPSAVVALQLITVVAIASNFLSWRADEIRTHVMYLIRFAVASLSCQTWIKP